MEIKVARITDWKEVLNAARTTVSMSELDKEPSDKFKLRMLLSEHSPIRNLLFKVEMIGIPTYVSTHFARHKQGVEHFVSTQREDRTDKLRSERNQIDPVNHTMIINAQALINMSRVRLCLMSDLKTVGVMTKIKSKIEEIEPYLAEVMQPNCVYRAGCFEFGDCLYYTTEHYNKKCDMYNKLRLEAKSE